MAGPWVGVRVVETAGLAGAYATRLWAALGAEVTVVEPPTGHPLRHLPPFAPGTDEDKVIAGIRPEANLKLVEDLCEVMTDGSLCAMGGLTPMPVMSAVKHFPEDFDKPARMAAE